MSIRSLLFFQVALCLVSLQAHAGEIPVPQCPRQLAIQQNVLTQPEDGWKAVHNNDSQWLEQMVISVLEYNSPALSGIQKPFVQKLPKGNSIHHYDTYPIPSGHDYWVVCQYMLSAVTLVRKLPENVMRCEVKYINDVMVPDRVTIKCFDTPWTR